MSSVSCAVAVDVHDLTSVYIAHFRMQGDSLVCAWSLQRLLPQLPGFNPRD